MGRVIPWLGIALLGGCAAFVAVDVATATVGTDGSRPTSAIPTRTEAEALLTKAYRLAQARDYAGLCQTVAQDRAACEQVLQWADIAHAAPSAEAPIVLGAAAAPATPTTQGAEVLRIQDTGSASVSDFSVVRTTDGQIRSQNAVYWYSTFRSPEP